MENHGVDPDVEVVMTPQDRVSGNDAQLDPALTIALQQLKKSPPLDPPSVPER